MSTLQCSNKCIINNVIIHSVYVYKGVYPTSFLLSRLWKTWRFEHCAHSCVLSIRLYTCPRVLFRVLSLYNGKKLSKMIVGGHRRVCHFLDRCKVRENLLMMLSRSKLSALTQPQCIVISDGKYRAKLYRDISCKPILTGN